MRFTSSLAAGALATGASAKIYSGFNSGATTDDGTLKVKADFAKEFKTAQNFDNAPTTFNAVRLYTNIQGDTGGPIEAFEAAIESETHMLLGVWASGTDSIDKEISALKQAVKQHGTKFTDLVIGISIGSEDLYRDSTVGIKNDAGIGAGPDVVTGFIKDFRDAFKDSTLSDILVGHVDTYDVWDNTTIKSVIDAVDFIGVNGFPYYEEEKENNITNSGTLFDTSFARVAKAAGDKPIFVTETGWPYKGETMGDAEASIKNAKYYWNEVGCRKLFNKMTTFWYTLRDANPANTMKFAITDNLSTEPRFDLSCPDTFETPSSTTSSSSSKSSSGSSSSGSGSATGTATSSGADSTSTSDSDSGSDSSSSDSSSAAASGSEGTSSASETSPAQAGAASLQKFSAVVYGALALAGGAYYLF